MQRAGLIDGASNRHRYPASTVLAHGLRTGQRGCSGWRWAIRLHAGRYQGQAAKIGATDGSRRGLGCTVLVMIRYIMLCCFWWTGISTGFGVGCFCQIGRIATSEEKIVIRQSTIANESCGDYYPRPPPEPRFV